jgi:Lsr2
MAQQVRLVDDVDQDSDAVCTISYMYEGKAYQIDLCEENRDRFNGQMQEWIPYSRRAGKPPPVVAARRSVTAETVRAGDSDDWWTTPAEADHATRQQYTSRRKKMRDWGNAHGHPTANDMGRIPRELAAAYLEAMNEQQRHRRGTTESPEPVPEPEHDDGQESFDMEPAPTEAPPSTKRSHRRTRTLAATGR